MVAYDPELETQLLSYKDRKINFQSLSTILEYSQKNNDFFVNHPDLLKKTIHEALSYKTMDIGFSTHLSILKSNILIFFTKATQHLDIYDNDWLTSNINAFFKIKNMPSGKKFFSLLDDFKKASSNLQFPEKICPGLKNIIDDNSCMTLYQPLSFHCKVNVSKLNYQLNAQENIIRSNIRTCLTHLKTILNKDNKVYFTNEFTECKNNIFSIVVLHNSKEIEKKLPDLIDYFCYHIDHQALLKNENMNSIFLKFKLDNDLKNNTRKSQSIKI